MPDIRIELREHIKDTDWGVEINGDGVVHIYENVQRDGGSIWVKPEVWDAVVKSVERLRVAQFAARRATPSEEN